MIHFSFILTIILMLNSCLRWSLILLFPGVILGTIFMIFPFTSSFHTPHRFRVFRTECKRQVLSLSYIKLLRLPSAWVRQSDTKRGEVFKDLILFEDTTTSAGRDHCWPPQQTKLPLFSFSGIFLIYFYLARKWMPHIIQKIVINMCLWRWYKKRSTRKQNDI